MNCRKYLSSIIRVLRSEEYESRKVRLKGTPHLYVITCLVLPIVDEPRQVCQCHGKMVTVQFQQQADGLMNLQTTSPAPKTLKHFPTDGEKHLSGSQSSSSLPIPHHN